jgi:hypothetical protein
MQKSDKSSKLIPDTLEQLRDIETTGLGSAGLIERDFNEIRKDGEYSSCFSILSLPTLH